MDTLAHAEAPNHAIPLHELLLLLETDPARGLTEDEADIRLQRIGPNALPSQPRRGSLARFGAQFLDPLIYLLLAAAAATALTGATVDAGVILAVVLANAGIGFVQEGRAEAALESLVNLVRTEATVIRDGTARRIPSEQVVPGDVLRLAEGDKAVADLRLVEVSELSLDESALTGEPVPVVKRAVEVPAATGLSDRSNMVYAGTLAVRGRGSGVVVATGSATELGLIHTLVGKAEPLQTPLQQQIARFSRALTWIIAGLAGVTFSIGVARGEPVETMLTAAVALAVGAIPEGLPAVVTITLAIGVSRMAGRNVIIRRLPAVETLGSTTVICTDKTGTLTMNAMTVTRMLVDGGAITFTSTGYDPRGELVPDPPSLTADSAHVRAALATAMLCSDADVREVEDRWEPVGDPMEAALVVAARKAGLASNSSEWGTRIATLPFDSERRYMAVLHRHEGGGLHLHLKGAVERVVELCTDRALAAGGVGHLDIASVLADAESMAARGLRVLALADGRPLGHDLDEGTLSESHLEQEALTFLGLIGLEDPPRPEARAAVAACYSAGVAVKMITGDHAATAAAIAAQIGLQQGPEPVARGTELAAASPADLPALAERTSVFARVTAEQKLQLVRALQSRGHVVAMTGDGVNDAPALKQADLGVAMGRAGTEVAAESADVVITDDNFASIEAAVEEGRGVFENLTRFIAWVLPASIGEALVVIAAIVGGTVLPILPVQVLWVNMTTTVGLVLAFEPAAADLMRRPPRDPRRPLLNRDVVMRTLLVSGLMLVAAFGLFRWEQSRGVPLAEARTVTMCVFVLVELVYLFNCRSLERALFPSQRRHNPALWLGAIGLLVLQMCVTYLPPANALFHTAPIDARAWLRVMMAAAGAFSVVELEKAIRRRVERRARASHSDG